MEDNIIEVRHLSVTYGEKKVIDDTSFSLEKGKIYGLVGENGSGKTTLISSLLGLIPWNEGSINLFGKDVNYSRDKSYIFTKCSAVLQDVSLPKRLTVRECFSLFRTLGNGSTGTDDIISLLNLEEQVNSYYSDLSFGQKQRVLVGTAILQEFDILFLDEPTNGLDKNTVDSLFMMMDLLKRQSKTIIFISHRKEEIQHICDEIMTIRNGKVNFK